MKKFVSLFISFCILFCSFSLMASAEEQVVLNVYNWGEYIEQETINLFEEKYPHIDVNYTTFDSNEAMYSKIVSGAASYDIVIPSEYMVSKLIQEEMLAELDFSNTAGGELSCTPPGLRSPKLGRDGQWKGARLARR